MERAPAGITKSFSMLFVIVFRTRFPGKFSLGIYFSPDCMSKYMFKCCALSRYILKCCVLQVGYSTTSPELSNPVKYSRFARAIETSDLHHMAMIRVMQTFGWQKLAKLSIDVDFVQHVSIGVSKHYLELMLV